MSIFTTAMGGVGIATITNLLGSKKKKKKKAARQFQRALSGREQATRNLGRKSMIVEIATASGPTYAIVHSSGMRKAISREMYDRFAAQGFARAKPDAFGNFQPVGPAPLLSKRDRVVDILQRAAEKVQAAEGGQLAFTPIKFGTGIINVQPAIIQAITEGFTRPGETVESVLAEVAEEAPTISAEEIEGYAQEEEEPSVFRKYAIPVAVGAVLLYFLA